MTRYVIGPDVALRRAHDEAVIPDEHQILAPMLLRSQPAIRSRSLSNTCAATEQPPYRAKTSATSALADSHRRQISCSRGASG